jgi:hypothetical protein
MIHWTLLKDPPTWGKILHSTKHIADVDKNITNILDEDGLSDEFIDIANISKSGIQNHLPTAFERRSEIFEFGRMEYISLK